MFSSLPPQVLWSRARPNDLGRILYLLLSMALLFYSLMAVSFVTADLYRSCVYEIIYDPPFIQVFVLPFLP